MRFFGKGDPGDATEPQIIHVLFAICLVASLALLYVRSQEPALTQMQVLLKYWYLPVTATVTLVTGVVLRIRHRDSLKPKDVKKSKKK